MSTPAPLIMMLAGGTGGHVYPALAVASELLQRGYRVEWVGTARGLEASVVPAAGICLHRMPMRGVRGKGPLQKLLALFAAGWSFLLALLLLVRRSPRCVIGMGGYVSAPAGLAAWLLRRPLLLHEQNAVAGTTNRLLAPFARVLVCGFPGAFRKHSKAEVVGNPVRRELLERARASQWFYDGSRPLRLLVLGGSLGSRPINELLPAALQLLDGRPAAAAPEVWHQCGAADLDTVQARYREAGRDRVRCEAFIDDMASAYAWSDLVLCRAGALTVAELAIMSRPALLVPLPHAIDDHQTMNARYLSERGAALLCLQSELSAARLADLLAELMADPARLAQMSLACAACAWPAATAAVADRCEGLL